MKTGGTGECSFPSHAAVYSDSPSMSFHARTPLRSRLNSSGGFFRSLRERDPLAAPRQGNAFMSFSADGLMGFRGSLMLLSYPTISSADAKTSAAGKELLQRERLFRFCFASTPHARLTIGSPLLLPAHRTVSQSGEMSFTKESNFQ